VLAGNSEKLRNLRLSQPRRWYYIFPQHGAGMSRTAIWVALGSMSHEYFSSVILLEIDAARVAIFEFERDTPRSIDMDRAARRSEAAQRMEIKAWNIHFFWPRGNV
jgi:hypothetical protein